jgi:hypothetical protein
VIRILLVAARARPQRGDPELLHHLLVIFLSGPVLRLGQSGLGRALLRPSRPGEDGDEKKPCAAAGATDCGSSEWHDGSP